MLPPASGTANEVDFGRMVAVASKFRFRAGRIPGVPAAEELKALLALAPDWLDGEAFPDGYPTEPDST